jgi:hypothetical protein
MKIKALLYCCKTKPYLYKQQTIVGDKFFTFEPFIINKEDIVNGKIACECEVETEEINYEYYGDSNYSCYDSGEYFTKTIEGYDLEERSCVEFDEMIEYFRNSFEENKDKVGYALHLFNVKERVMDLSKCHTKKIERIKVLGSPYGDLDSVAYHFEKREILVPITKAPQNMMWCWIKENGKWVRHLIISVRPQWLCKILNGEKTIEVRRKVLKGMVD